jgi:hypothetical protein
MPNVVDCPECRKAMKLSDAAASKRVRCPNCKHIFVAPAEEEEPEVVECDIVEEPVKRPAKRSIPDEDEEYARPRRSIRRDEVEDDEDDRPQRRRRDDDDDRPVKRRRKRAKRQVEVSSEPIILGILACVFCCLPILGIPFGQRARSKADEESDRLPEGSRYESAHQQLRLAHLLGTIGIVLGVIVMFVALAIKIYQLNQ